jgi:hypothetical protein
MGSSEVRDPLRRIFAQSDRWKKAHDVDSFFALPYKRHSTNTVSALSATILSATSDTSKQISDTDAPQGGAL